MKSKKMIIGIIVITILILVGVYVYMQFKIPHIGEFYIRNVKENELLSEEKQEIISILNLTDIDIYKIACEVDYRHEGSYFVFFYSNRKLSVSDIDDSFNLYCLGYENEVYNYVIEKISMATYSDMGYNKISEICKNNYKWWKNNEKRIDVNEIQNYKLIKLTTIYDKDGNVIE